MTIEQKKISLINWITNLEDEHVIDQIEGFRKSSLDELPKEIVELLEISDSESLSDCFDHTTSRAILSKQ